MSIIQNHKQKSWISTLLVLHSTLKNTKVVPTMLSTDQCWIAERIKIRKKRNKTGQHTNNHWKGYSTDKEGSQLEVFKAGWSPRSLTEKFSSITWKFPALLSQFYDRAQTCFDYLKYKNIFYCFTAVIS